MTASLLPNAPVIAHPDLFDEAGTLQPMPAAFWAEMPSHTFEVIPLADCSRASGGTDFLAIVTRRREVF